MKPALLLDTDPHIEVMAEAEKKKEEKKQEEEEVEMKLLSISRCRLSLVRIQCGACSWPDEAQHLYAYIIHKEEREELIDSILMNGVREKAFIVENWILTEKSKTFIIMTCI
jgi:hypothetical protein